MQSLTLSHTLYFYIVENLTKEQHNIKEVEETVKYLVQNLQNYDDLQGRNISFDCLYTVYLQYNGFYLSHHNMCEYYSIK